MADDLVVREWDTAMMPCLEVKVAIAEHNALRRAYLALLKSWNEDESDSHHALEEWEKLDAQLAASEAARDQAKADRNTAYSKLARSVGLLNEKLAASEAARGRMREAFEEVWRGMVRVCDMQHKQPYQANLVLQALIQIAHDALAEPSAEGESC